MITDLQRQFEQFIGSGDTGEEPPEGAADEPTQPDDAENAYGDDEGDDW